MSMNAFMNREHEPSSQDVNDVLENAAKSLQHLDIFIDENIKKTSREWKYYNKKSGWVRKTYSGKRNLFFLTMYQGFFRITFVFGNRAVEAIKKSDLPQNIIQQIVDARQYAEGRGLSMDINSLDDLKTIYTLLDIKIQN